MSSRINKTDKFQTLEFSEKFQEVDHTLDQWYDPAILLDTSNDVILRVNLAFSSNFQEFILDKGEKLSDLIPGFQPNGTRTIDTCQQHFNTLFDTGETQRFNIFLHRNGNDELFELTVSISQKWEKIVVLVFRQLHQSDTDISDLETALYMSELKADLILNKSNICSFIFDCDGKIKNVSDTVKKLLSIQNEDADKLELSTIIDKQDLIKFESIRSGNFDDCKNKIIRLSWNGKEQIYVKPLGPISKIEYQNTSQFLFLFQDLTDQLKTNDVLIKSLNEYRSIIDASPTAILKCDIAGRITFANNQAVSLHGMSVSEMKNRNINELFKPSNSSFLELLIKKLDKQKKGKGRKVLYAMHSSGRDLIVELNYSKLESSNSEGYLLSYIDITEKEKFRLSIKQINSKLDSFINYSNTGIIQIDHENNIESVSENISSLFPSQSTLIDENILNLIHQNSSDSFLELIKQIRQKGESHLAELIELKPLNDDKTLVQVSGKLVSNTEKGNIVLIWNNYSDKVKSELALIEQESLMHNLLENSPYSIYAIDKLYNIIFINKKAIQDFRKQDISIKLGDNLEDKIPNKLFAEWKRDIYSKVFKGEKFNRIGALLGNSKIIVDNRYSPLLDLYGNVNGCIEVSNDITTIKNREYELIEREAYISSILNSSPNSILVVDTLNYITAFNPNAEIYFEENCEHKLEIGIHIEKLFSQEELPEYLAILERVRSGEIVTYLKKINNSSDRIQYFEFTYTPVKDKHNAIIGSKLLIQNQTLTLMSETALMESEIKYKQLLGLIPGGIIITSSTGKLLYNSPTMNEILGIPKSSPIIDFRYSTFINDIENLKTIAQDNLELGSSSAVFQIEAKKLDGSIIWLKARSKHIKLQGEKAILTLLLDITDKVKSEKDRDLKQKLYEVLIENSFDGIDVTELISGENESWTPKLLMRNDKMKQFFNSDSNPYFFKRDLLDRLPAYQPDGQKSEVMLSNILKTLWKNNQIVTEGLYLDASSQQRHLMISAQKLSFDSKTILIRYIKDITDKKQNETQIKENLIELNKKNKELEKYIASNMNLENFAFVASHDLKSPLRTILSFSQLLIKDIYEQIPEKNKTYLDIIKKSSNSMQQLIDDVLAFSTISTDDLKISDIHVDSFFKFIITQLNDEIVECNANIKLTGDFPQYIQSDSIKLTQILHNLIRNGIKFQKPSSTPQILISMDDLNTHWQFNVKDNGIGIESKYINDIFKIFNRLHTKDKFQGSGIGLSTCKKIASILGGKIYVKSIRGEGSTFSFTVLKNEVKGKNNG